MNRLATFLSRRASRVPSAFTPTTRIQYRNYSSPTSHNYEHILFSTPRPGVGQITLNRPKALNAVFSPLINELNTCLRACDSDSSVHCIVITGSAKAFAAGADIKEMAPKTYADAYGNDFVENWADIVRIKKPIISAVNGYALGGGCELAMMADIIYASKSAQFGQPEIKLGIIPAAGGSQRLTHAIGKSKAMEICLTGDMFSGEQAEKWGLVAKVFDDADACVEGALKTAEKIAGHSRIAVKACKEAVNKSQELPLTQGLDFERRLFHGLFGSQDQKIGMEAFVNKKKPEWKHE